MSRKIPLQNGMFAIVDEEDYERCMEFNWTLGVAKGTSYYVYRKIGNKSEMLADFVLGRGKNEINKIHFLNKNQLDFKKENLSEVPHNHIMHTTRPRMNSTSRFKGVHWNKQRNCWQAYIMADGKNRYLGRSDSEEEAAILYNEAALFFFGEHSYQNNILVDDRVRELPKPKAKAKPRPSHSKTSVFTGVSRRPNGRYKAYIYINKKQINLGTFGTQEEAAKAYDKKAYELYGNKAILNFPDDYK